MRNYLRRHYDSYFPSAEEVWERAGADNQDGVPVFKLEPVGEPKQYKPDVLYARSGWHKKKIGQTTMLKYTLSDGIDRLVKVRTLDDGFRCDADFITTTSTAFMTGLDGYAGERDDRIAIEHGIQSVGVSAEFGAHDLPLGLDVFRLPKAVPKSMTLSLAKAAQAEQLIIADVSERFDLPTNQYAIGDSRGAMLKPGHSLYAPMHGAEVVYTDMRAPCLPERLAFEDVPRVGVWMGVETIGGAAVLGSLISDGDGGVIHDTFDLNPLSVTTGLLGTVPILASGEAGELAQLAPDDMKGHLVLYGHDILSSVHRWHEIYSSKEGVVKKDVPRGSHAHLLKRHELQRARVGRTVEEWHRTGGTFGSVDWMYVSKGREKQNPADLRLVVG